MAEKLARRFEIRLGGTGGQGLILGAKMLADALSQGGLRVAQSQTYEPTSRGGFCHSDLVVSAEEIGYPLATAIDYLVLLDQMAVKPSVALARPGALVIADTRLCPRLPEGDFIACRLALSRTALDLGSERVANIVALGALVALTGICERDALERALRADTPRSFLDLNVEALQAGFRIGAQAARAAEAPAAVR